MFVSPTMQVTASSAISPQTQTFRNCYFLNVMQHMRKLIYGKLRSQYSRMIMFSLLCFYVSLLIRVEPFHYKCPLKLRC